jgi:transcriptional regulator of aromatic amino acid metabolism
VSCGAIPNDLIDSILFGHKKGAFTGDKLNQSKLPTRFSIEASKEAKVFLYSLRLVCLCNKIVLKNIFFEVKKKVFQKIL